MKLLLSFTLIELFCGNIIKGTENESEDNYQMDEALQKQCKDIQCNSYTSCNSCEFNNCCQFNLEKNLCLRLLKLPFNYTELIDRSKGELKNLSEYPDPQMNVTFPKCNIVKEVPLYNATNYLYKHHDICGVPKYCPNQSYYVSAESKIIFQNVKQQVGQGELCTIYFQGRMGPEFLLQIGIENLSQIEVNADLSICLSVGLFDDFPCIDSLQQIQLTKSLYYRIRANQFRITLQFKDDAEIDFSQIFYQIISIQKLSQQNQQQLFQFIIIVLLTILGSFFIMALIRIILIRIFGRRFVEWLDPEPIFPQRRRNFNVQLEFEKLKSQNLIHQIKQNEMKFEQDRCAYCLESFQTGIIIEIFCGHCFHELCILNHMQIQRNVGRCSICLVDINKTNYQLLQQQSTQESLNIQSQIQENQSMIDNNLQ
ncbi:unnamed protein product [Paramecium primaurelia]|uniref:RING-type domain-containing protein n=1 Tax=Paramecium primaurelia TaxID=5886 RepID=A0A8S1MXV3_PARPR|nr:unnamed protein product [Paramecium primaurelia]